MKKLFAVVAALLIFTSWSATTYLPIHPAPVSADVVTGGLIAWWRFDEGSGTTVADSSGNGSSTTLSGSGYTWTTSNGSHGALNFDATDGKSSFSVDTGSDNYSFSFWIFPVPSSDDYGCLCTDSGGNYGVFYRGSTRKISFYTAGDDLFSTALTENAWHHITIVTRDSGTSSSFYVDGVLDSVSVRSAAQKTYQVMGNDASAESFKGKVSNFRIYNRKLTSGEVSTLFANP